MNIARLTRTFSLVLATLLILSSAIPAAEPTAWPVPDWQTAKPESQGLSSAGLEKVRVWLQDHGSKTGMVIRHGRIVGEWYFQDAKPTSTFLVYSTSKSFSSTAAGLAIAEGKLRLDTKVGELLPDVSPAEKREITVRHLISMDSGVHNNPKVGELPKLFSYAMYEAPMDFKPGQKWDYNNTGLALLSPVIRKATGQDIDKLLNDRVFVPIGITESDWTWDHNEGYPLSYSGLHITARALARFGLMFLNNGKWQDRSIIPAAWTAEASGPSQDMNKTYGYLWWNNSTGEKWKGVPKDAFAAMGRFDNSMLIVPGLDLIVLRQVGDDSANPHKMVIGELWKLAVDAVQP